MPRPTSHPAPLPPTPAVRGSAEVVQASSGDVFFQQKPLGRVNKKEAPPPPPQSLSRKKRTAPAPPGRSSIQGLFTATHQPAQSQAQLCIDDRETAGTHDGTHQSQVSSVPDNKQLVQYTAHASQVLHTPHSNGNTPTSTGKIGSESANSLDTESSYSPRTLSSGEHMSHPRAPQPPGLDNGHLGPSNRDSQGARPPSNPASSLSDSGTAESYSSGYTSEDVSTDALRLHPVDMDPLHSGQDVSHIAVRNGHASVMGSSATDPDTGGDWHEDSNDWHGDSDDEAFGEDEFTLDFEEEDDVGVESRHTVIYKEYTGEDYSRYLQDDQDQGNTPAPVPLPQRKGKYHKRKGPAPGVPAPVDPNRSSSRNSNPGVKDRFSQMFTLSKHRRVKTPAAAPSSRRRPDSIQNFSFADSKMGEILQGIGTDEDQRIPDSTLSDAGLKDSFWNTDTLSAKSLRRHPADKLRKKRSGSLGDLLDSPPPRSNSSYYNPDSYSKSEAYESQGRESGKKNQGLWSKLTSTLRKKDKALYNAKVKNGESKSANIEPDTQDIRL